MDRDLTEILAMNLWMGGYGQTSITHEWQEFAKSHPAKARQFRAQADDMLGVAHSHIEQGKRAKAKTTHHTGLDWLFHAPG